jgi:hypothetical protein
VLSAAVAVIAVGLGLYVLVPQFTEPTSTNSANSGSGATQDQPAAAPGAAVAGAGTQVASGRDYTPGAFGDLANSTGNPLAAVPSAQPDQGRGNSAQEQGPAAASTDGGPGRSTPGIAPEPGTVPPELVRLVGPAARLACLDAVQTVHGGVPVVLDYARFAGRPALIVLLRDSRTGAGRPWVVVVGPGCGQPAGVTDERYNGPAA